MNFYLKEISTGTIIRTFCYVTNVEAAVIPGKLVIVCEKENYILAIEKGEMLVMDKDV